MKARQKLLAKHPDAQQILESDDFQGWVLRQPPMVERALWDGAVEDLIEILDKYKAAVGYGKPIVTPPRFTRAQIAAMSNEEFVAREKDIDRAIKRGLIR